VKRNTATAATYSLTRCSVRAGRSQWQGVLAVLRPRSSRRLEPFEAQREPIAVGGILRALRQPQQSSVQPLDGLKHRAIPLGEQALGDMQAIVRIDPNQVGVEGGMVDLGQGNGSRRVTMS
jgi:hypothetical protein